MDNILSSLSGTPGVIGTAVFDSDHACLLHDLPLPYEPVLFIDVLSSLNIVLDSYHSMDPACLMKAFTVKFENGSLMMRFVGDYTICVIADETVNVPMLNVAFNVIRRKTIDGLTGSGEWAGGSASVPNRSSWRPAPSQDLDQEWVRPSMNRSVRSLPGGASSPSQDLSPVYQSQASTGAVSTSSVGGVTKPKWGTREEWKRLATPNSVGRKVMTNLLRTYAAYVGPEAKPILEAEIAALGATPMTVHAGQFSDLIQAAAKRIRKRSLRQEFLTKALGDG